MKIQFLAVSFLSVANAFSTRETRSVSQRASTTKPSSTILFSTADKKKPLSPKEFVAQQRAKSGLPTDEHPKIFSDELLDDMKEILLILEKRVQEGPGSIDSEEIDRFASMSKNVLDEMKQKEYERLEDATSPAAAPPAPVTASVEAPPAEPVAAEASKPESMEDGPDYDPAGGQGSLAKGTRNTYIIPGMDEMSSDEYRLALQQSLIDEQAKRKKNGAYGNRNTWDYLNNLSGGSGVLKKDELED